MCKVISVANIKGGVAKTTTAANLGVGLVKKGKRVLLVDLDPQGSLSLGLGIRNNKELPYTVSTVIQKVINEIEISEGEGIIHNDEGVDILPSNHSLRTVEQQLDEVMSKEHILEEYIDGIRDRYDYIIMVLVKKCVGLTYKSQKGQFTSPNILDGMPECISTDIADFGKQIRC